MCQLLLQKLEKLVMQEQLEKHKSWVKVTEIEVTASNQSIRNFSIYLNRKLAELNGKEIILREKNPITDTDSISGF